MSLKRDRKAIETSSSPMNRLIAIAVAFLMAESLSAAPLAAAQQQSQTSNPSTVKTSAPARTTVLASSEEDYRIGAGDVIEVQVEDMPEISRSFRVTTAGTFLMPILGRMTAIKKTPEELAQEIADRLRGDYLKDPKVLVFIKEYTSRSFFIQGSVRSPGVFQIEGKPSLLTLITLAGGLADNHGAVAFIIRKAKDAAAPAADPSPDAKADPASGDADEDGTNYELVKVNINGLLRGNFNNNALLQPGDIVNIPQTDVFYVAGEVNAPGSFPLKEGTTLRQAISLAQGTNYKAAKDRTIIFRDDENGKRQELTVDVGAIMSGKKPDIQLMANDIVMVPNSRGKAIGGALLRAFGLTTITRVPVP
ncbi:MAG TPA: polysaccharide biosynthesis/export family protein [Blastocatellia bacterium]|nr:polysaccharide biosynthesis/export family protein [Blastocatellia bacterium]